MKKCGWLMILCWIMVIGGPVFSEAEDFLGAPLIPDGKINLKTDSRLEMESPLTHDQIVAFYKEKFAGIKDIKFRNWAEDTYIEDDSNLKWHSITIPKKQEGGVTKILIVKDSWTWILGTLTLRFTGTFVVLILLFAGMSLTGAINRRILKAEPNKA